MRTGVFWDQSREQVLVYWRDQLVAQYPSMAAFVAAHLGWLMRWTSSNSKYSWQNISPDPVSVQPALALLE